MPKFLAFDIGNSAGRAMIGTLEHERLSLEEVHRFPNDGVPVLGTLYWDILHIWYQTLVGLRKAAATGESFTAIGVDAWGCDFALLDESGALVDNPVHNRDARTNNMLEHVCEQVPREEIYEYTGLQFMQINSLYQLYAMVLSGAPALRNADRFLMIADVINYWLTGRAVSEFTSASLTQFYNPRTGDWARDLLKRLGIPTAILPPVVQPGEVLGPLVVDVPGLEGVPVVAIATHDTGSAVVAVPATGHERFAYISSGTWSLMGAEVREPVITPKSLEHDFTNEGGAEGTFRLLKNILGMWLIQECRRTWAAAGKTYTYDQITQMAEAAPPFGPIIDPHPNSPHFREPGDMPARVRDFCAQTGQRVPSGEGEILRCIYESLALKYRQTLAQLEEVLGHAIDVIHIVGGGSRSALLCQFTADATGRPVVAGPDEATAIGNVVMQAVATGHLDSVAAGRAMVTRSFDLKRYEPDTAAASQWDAAFSRFTDIAE